MKLQNLCTTGIETIHKAFIDAFSEYEVKIDMPIEKLNEMLLTRDYNPFLSIGCFENNRLIGFILTGYRSIDNTKCCYDVATGVIKEYQNRHVGSILIKELKRSIERNGINQFQLEVLENNIAARKLYEKNGFSITRRLRCYEKEPQRYSISKTLYEVSRDSEVLRSINENEYVSYKPTWQNSLKAFYNNMDKYYVISLLDSTIIVGYGVIHKEKGDILQVGVKGTYRDKGIEELLIDEMANSISKSKVRLLNIEDNSYMQKKMEENKYNNFVNQYEMIYINKGRSIFS
jgi:ribosomal protein S18 acetylase RimI-like enzyme